MTDNFNFDEMLSTLGRKNRTYNHDYNRGFEDGTKRVASEVLEWCNNKLPNSESTNGFEALVEAGKLNLLGELVVKMLKIMKG